MLADLTSTKKAEYDSLKGHTALEKFRLELAELKLACCEKTRDRSQKLSKTEANVGVHLPIGVIMKKEGGWQDPSAVIAGCSRVLKCIALNGKYIKWNQMSERWEFWFSRKYITDSFEKTWAERSNMLDKKTPAKATTSSVYQNDRTNGFEP